MTKEERSLSPSLEEQFAFLLILVKGFLPKVGMKNYFILGL
jgi:hypothetical protein